MLHKIDIEIGWRPAREAADYMIFLDDGGYRAVYRTMPGNQCVPKLNFLSFILIDEILMHQYVVEKDTILACHGKIQGGVTRCLKESCFPINVSFSY